MIDTRVEPDTAHREGSPMAKKQTLDNLDARIVAALQVDGRVSFSKLAKDLGVAEGVVRYRYRKLESSDVLRVVGIADPLKVGFEVMVLLGLKVRPGTTDAVVSALNELAEVSYLVVTSGSIDMFCEVMCRDHAHFGELLHERVHQIDGIVETQSFMVLKTPKLSYGWGTSAVPLAQTED